MRGLRSIAVAFVAAIAFAKQAWERDVADDQNSVVPAMGWLGIDQTQQHFAAQFPLLSAVAPQLYGSTSTEPILLYKAWKDVLGNYPDYPAQQIGDCFPAGTMVLGETIKPIEDVRVGDRVWTGEGKLTRVVSTREIVSHKPLVTIKLRGSTPLVCTADHRVLARKLPVIHGKRVTKPAYERAVNGGGRPSTVVSAYEASELEWVAAGDLTSDHFLVSPTSYTAVSPPDDAILAPFLRSPEGRELLGYYVGNGSASGGTVELAMSDSTLTDRYVSALAALGFRPAVSEYRADCGAHRIRVHSRQLVRCFREHFRSSGGSKKFPGWMIGDSDFVSGLHAADGSIDTHARAVDSTSKSVVAGLLASLRVLGFNPTVHLAARSKGTYPNAKSMYRVYWTLDVKRHQTWRDDGFVHHKVEGVEFREGPAVVYDIGVADAHHSFVADGFAVHNCVSFGAGHAVDLLQGVEIALGEPTEYRETHTEFIYATSREVAGILGGGDGSYGAAAVKAMQQIGVVTREMLGSDGPYAGSRAKDWGRRGAPAQYKQAAAAFKLGGAAQVRTWADLVAAKQNGYLTTIASNQGFALERDAQGFCRPRGSWEHQMFIAGVRFDREGALICQSWGPTNPSGPLDLDQPSFSFWADRSVVERILAQGDSWALSKAPDFVKRPLPSTWTYASLA